MNDTPTVNYPMLLGQLLGLCKCREILSPFQFDARWKEIEIELNEQEKAVTDFYSTVTTKEKTE